MFYVLDILLTSYFIIFIGVYYKHLLTIVALRMETHDRLLNQFYAAKSPEGKLVTTYIN